MIETITEAHKKSACNNCLKLQHQLTRQIQQTFECAHANEKLTAKLKECRLVLRKHGLGHEYPGVDKTYEKNMEYANNGSTAYYDLLNQYRHLQQAYNKLKVLPQSKINRFFINLKLKFKNIFAVGVD